MTIDITCSIGTTDPSAQLGLEIWIDDKKLVDVSHVTAEFEFSHDFPEEEGNHELRFVLKNKLPEHTKIDEDGNIVKDACLTISDLAFGGTVHPSLLMKNAVYTHNFNGNGETVKEAFYGTMGCNGAVTLPFSAPVYIWLLENMV